LFRWSFTALNGPANKPLSHSAGHSRRVQRLSAARAAPVAAAAASMSRRRASVDSLMTSRWKPTTTATNLRASVDSRGLRQAAQQQQQHGPAAENHADPRRHGITQMQNLHAATENARPENEGPGVTT